MFRIHLHLIMNTPLEWVLFSPSRFWCPFSEALSVPFYPGLPRSSAEGLVWSKENHPDRWGHGSGLKCQTREFEQCSANGEMTCPGPSVYTARERRLPIKKKSEDVPINSRVLPCGHWHVSLIFRFTGLEWAITDLGFCLFVYLFVFWGSLRKCF